MLQSTRRRPHYQTGGPDAAAERQKRRRTADTSEEAPFALSRCGGSYIGELSEAEEDHLCYSSDCTDIEMCKHDCAYETDIENSPDANFDARSSPAMKSKEMSPTYSPVEPVGAPPGLANTARANVDSPCVSPTCEARTSCASNRVPPAFLPNPERADELRDEIAFLLRREHEAVTIHGRKRVVPGYLLSVQNGCLLPYMRRRVFDWMLEVADNHLRLTNQALQLSFNYFDRFLSKTVYSKEKLQFVATACLWVASKCCSTDCPVATATQLERLVGCDLDKILEMELELLRCLDYEMMPVTSYDLIQLCLPFLDVPNQSNLKKLTQYVENISLAQVIVYPLLDFGAISLAVSSVVCGMRLMTGVVDDDLCNQLSQLAGTSPELTRTCRRHTETNINLEQLTFGRDSVES